MSEAVAHAPLPLPRASIGRGGSKPGNGLKAVPCKAGLRGGRLPGTTIVIAVAAVIAVVIVIVVAAVEALRREERQVGVVEREHEELVRVVAVADGRRQCGQEIVVVADEERVLRDLCAVRGRYTSRPDQT